MSGKYARPFLVRMDYDLRAAVAATADREDRSQASVVREALREYTQRSAGGAVVGCTGLTARWCPLHGTCICPPGGEMDEPDCLLHGAASGHPITSAPSDAGG